MLKTIDKDKDTVTVNKENFKKYLNIQQLFQKLNNQGLIIRSEEFFSSNIKKVGYYKLINGYREFFGYKNNDGMFFYNKGVKFSEIVSLYDFDNNLRNVTFKYIMNIENHIKSLMSNAICENIGTCYSDYLQKENFKDDDSFRTSSEIINSVVKDIIEAYERTLIKAVPTIINKTIIHFHKNYNGKIPMWAIIDIVSIGKLHKLYKYMNDDLKKLVSIEFGIHQNRLENYLLALSIFRNISAHNQKLFSFKINNAIKFKNIKILLDMIGIDGDSETYSHAGRGYLSFIIILKLLLNDETFLQFVSDVKSLYNRLKLDINEKSFNEIILTMGLINDWENIVDYLK